MGAGLPTKNPKNKGGIAVIMQTCFMTPPFGFALFYVKALLPKGYTMLEVYKGVIPFTVYNSGSSGHGAGHARAGYRDVAAQSQLRFMI